MATRIFLQGPHLLNPSHGIPRIPALHPLYLVTALSHASHSALAEIPASIQATPQVPYSAYVNLSRIVSFLAFHWLPVLWHTGTLLYIEPFPSSYKPSWLCSWLLQALLILPVLLPSVRYRPYVYQPPVRRWIVWHVPK